MNDFLRDICTIIEGGGIATFATDLFASKEPDSPDDCITVYRSGGEDDDGIDITSQMERPSFQVRVRAKTYISAWDTLEQIDALFRNMQFNTVSDSAGETLYTTSRNGMPIDLPRDRQNRHIIAAGYRCMRQPKPA